MEEAEALADRVAVIADGRVVAEGTPATLGGRDRQVATVAGSTATTPAQVSTDDPGAVVAELASDWAATCPASPSPGPPSKTSTST